MMAGQGGFFERVRVKFAHPDAPSDFGESPKAGRICRRTAELRLNAEGFDVALPFLCPNFGPLTWRFSMQIEIVIRVDLTALIVVLKALLLVL